MILKECQDWITAAEQCLRRRRRRLTALRRAADEADRAAGPGLWQVGVSSSGLETATLRLVGPDGAPRLALDWSIAGDREQRRWSYRARPAAETEAVSSDGRAVRVRTRPFSRELLSDPAVSAVLGEFVALCPADSILVEWDSDGAGGWAQSARWGLRLRRPEPWPRFARLALAAPFAEKGTALAYLLTSRRVHEVHFDGAGVTAYLAA